jgi:hypothetical protein
MNHEPESEQPAAEETAALRIEEIRPEMTEAEKRRVLEEILRVLRGEQ